MYSISWRVGTDAWAPMRVTEMAAAALANFAASTGPGLGVEIDPDFIKKHRTVAA